MKKFLPLISLALLYSSNTYSQEICMVSADFQTGEDILVLWEWPDSTANVDSVLVYRQGPTGSFDKIGGTAFGALSSFTDFNAITTDVSRYKISYKYLNGTESPLSLWHQPMLLDYGLLPGTLDYGYINWTEYEIENQANNNYIVEYSCYMDQTGLGNFTLASTMPNTVLDWWDQSYNFNPNTKYVVEAELPNCNVTKANINTSRSNIKTQIANNEVGLESNTIHTLNVRPNPVEELLVIEDLTDFERLEIIDYTGSVVYTANPTELNQTINVAFLTSGVYLLRVRDSKGAIYANKLVKL